MSAPTHHIVKNYVDSTTIPSNKKASEVQGSTCICAVGIRESQNEHNHGNLGISEQKSLGISEREKSRNLRREKKSQNLGRKSQKEINL
jgi:hypothetical protein